MNVVVWARVSSREQREGYSIDAQLRASREKAQKAGWHVVREFVVAESAKRGAERVAFNEMFQWVKTNAKKQKIEAILSHKLDRVCRNMRDAVRLQELEDLCGVQLSFVENQFGPGAAGALSFNVMAAVAQYYSDNLRSEVIKGLDEKVRQGWPTGAAAYGYRNVNDKNEPIQPHPERSRTVVRIFELYANGSKTFQSLADQLAREGHIYRPSMPRFHRTALSYILNNRIYIGEILRNGQTFPGKHSPLVDRSTFDACQDVMHGRNRRTGNPDSPLAGGLFRCAYCGQSITGEHIRRKLKNGGVRHHLYYRCANNHPGPDHPRVRWNADDLEQAVITDLQRLRMPSPDIAAWFRTALSAAFSDITTQKRQQHAALAKRQAELKGMQDRLLNAFLSAAIDEPTFKAKSTELQHEAAKVDEAIEQLGDHDAASGDAALAIFDWSQNAAEIWRGSNNALRREILDSVCLNRTMSDVSLVAIKRKPFDVLAERPKMKESRDGGI
jgi:DNA invertase Pin-like site-specific DNA recombinase